MSNEQYPIFENRTYTLTYGDDLTYQVSGKQISDSFRREALIKEWLSDDVEWGNLDDVYYNSDLGEL